MNKTPDSRPQTPDASPHFRRSFRIHPRRGMPSGWGELAPVLWSDDGRFHGDACDPGDFLDYHTGCIYPQDAASQVPVLLLQPRAGETVVDVCAAPGSKSTQIGLALHDDGLLVCCDASPPRRAILAENLARQGITCALVTPMPVHVLAERHPGAADAVLVDAPCSGHALKSEKQRARMAERQLVLLSQAALLVRPGGRMVYSTCTPYREENEGVIEAFLATHPHWRIQPRALSGCDADSGMTWAGTHIQNSAVRLCPEHQGTEPFFACLLSHDDEDESSTDTKGFVGIMPARDPALADWLPQTPLICWRRNNTFLIGTKQVAACALPSEARGLILGHGHGGRHDTNKSDLNTNEPCRLDPWAAQALIERGAPARTISHQDACALWSGAELPLSAAIAGDLVKTDAGAPLGVLTGGANMFRLALPSRMRRSELQ